MVLPEPGRRAVFARPVISTYAGPATAYWLSRHGWEITLVERAGRLRTGGQDIDIRGAARDVMRRMRLEDAALRHGTGEKGTQFVDARGRAYAQFKLVTGRSFPRGAGSDFAGTVAGAADDAGLAVGDEVWGFVDGARHAGLSGRPPSTSWLRSRARPGGPARSVPSRPLP
jgi:2-polyprenyl-6-methoxyphenol hydroxylase-like FAD-dependent oxidoreductase